MAAQNQRISFANTRQPEYPDFLEIQIKSFQDFFQLETTPDNRKNEGLFKVFAENFPISDARNQFVLEFIDYFVDPPRYSIEECLERGLTYSVPFKAKLKLYCTDEEHEDFKTIIQDVYLGQIPYMTPKGLLLLMVPKGLLFLSFIVLREFSLDTADILMALYCIQHVLFLSKVRGWNLLLTLTMLCMHTLTEKRKFL